MRSYKYKGLIIYENDNSRFKNSPYYSVVNPKKRDKDGKMLHAHVCSEAQAKKLAKCFSRLIHTGVAGRYSLNTRSKAMRLIGYYIKMK